MHGDTAGHLLGVLAEPVFRPGVLHAVTVGFLTQNTAHIAFQQGAQAAEAMIIFAVLTAAAPLGFSV